MTLKSLLPLFAIAALVSGCESYGDNGPGYDGPNGPGYNNGPGYGPNGPPPPPPGYDSNYDASRYYRDDPQYQERPLAENDRIYRGQDGRYYCRRSDGTTGLIVGALAGGVLGDVIAPGGSKTLGTILGAGGGAIIGQQVDKNQARCR